MPESNRQPIIKGSKINKIFKVPVHQHRSVKERLANIFKRSQYHKFHALEDFDFEIYPGEFVSFIGPNGCGKSTLLKIISGIYEPTSGVMQVDGSISPFLELGVGFHPELSGRENVFLYGAVLGLTRKEIAAKYDEIVAFSELESFMDTPMRNFSSGMFVRLAFATAIQSDAPILIFDEVLAVGDAAFQKKCYAVFAQKKSANKCIVFVSHNLDAVKKYSDRVIFLNGGKKVMEGPAEVVIKAYEATVS